MPGHFILHQVVASHKNLRTERTNVWAQTEFSRGDTTRNFIFHEVCWRLSLIATGTHGTPGCENLIIAPLQTRLWCQMIEGRRRNNEARGVVI